VTDARSNKDPALIFVHIPKAAGTTLNHIIEAHYTQENSFATSMTRLHPEGSLDAFEALSDAERARIRLLNGHMGFGLHEKLPRPALYVTLLRHPVDRVVSNFYFEHREPHSYIYEELRSGRMGLKEYVSYYADVARLDNLQTRMIAGNWYLEGSGPCTPQMLETAKRNLKEHFALVGLSERFDAFYLLLKRTMGWPHSLFISHNITRQRPRKERPAPDELEVVREYNRYDLELYAYAGELFEAQLRRQDWTFPLELKAFQLLNGLYGLGWRARQFPLRARLRKLKNYSIRQRFRAFERGNR
jgi:hypothetical protein